MRTVMMLMILCAVPMMSNADDVGGLTPEPDAATAVEPVEPDTEVADPAATPVVEPPPVEPVPPVVEPDPVLAEVTVVAPPVDDPWSWSGIGWQLAGYVVPILGSMLIALVGFAIQWMRSKTDNLKWQAVLDQLDDAVNTAVSAVAQTTVDALRKAAKDGKLTQEQAREAFSLALTQVKTIIGTKGLDALQTGMAAGRDALDVFLRAKIEAAVAANKPPVSS